MTNPFESLKSILEVEGKKFEYYSLKALNDERVEKLPYSIRILLESCGKYIVVSNAPC